MYRDEFDLAILRLQEENRLEILKRKWWDGGKCPKEEDHRAKGDMLADKLLSLYVSYTLVNNIFIYVCLLGRTWHGEYRRDLCSPSVWPVNCHLHGSVGVYLDAATHSRNRGERGLFYLPLLCVLFSLATHLPS